jgi:hypothetical protein
LNTAPTLPLAKVPLVIAGGLTKAFTVTFTDVLTELYRVTSVGVNVMGCEEIPTLGTVDGEVKVNVPATDAEPPLKTEKERSCPEVIADEVGAEIIMGTARVTTKLVITSAAEL